LPRLAPLLSSEHFLRFDLGLGRLPLLLLLGPPLMLLLMLPCEMLLPLKLGRSCSYGLLSLKVQVS
jgi:hypothetical protein